MTTNHVIGLDLAGLPRVEGTWLVGTVAVGGAEEDGSPGTQVVLVVDEDSQLLLKLEAVSQADLDAAVKAVAAAFREVEPEALRDKDDIPRGLPARMVFSDRTIFDAPAVAHVRVGDPARANLKDAVVWRYSMPHRIVRPCSTRPSQASGAGRAHGSTTSSTTVLANSPST